VVSTKQSKVVLGGNWQLRSARILTKSSLTFCTCRAISHALHGSVNQTVRVLPFGCWVYTPHQAIKQVVLQEHNFKKENNPGDYT